MPHTDPSQKRLELLTHLQERGRQHPSGAASETGLDTVLNVTPQQLRDLTTFLTQLGYIEPSPHAATGQRLYRVTPAGLQASLHSQAHGSLQSQPGPAVHFQQTVHGTANTQVGSHNTMTVTVQSGVTQEQLVGLLAELKMAVHTLPAEEQAEAADAVQRAEQAVKEGAFDRLKRYSGVLLDLGTKSVEFGTKAHEFLTAVGLA